MSYEDMEMRWGPAFAQFLVREIEKASNINPQPDTTDPEARLSAALKAQDNSLAA